MEGNRQNMTISETENIAEEVAQETVQIVSERFKEIEKRIDNIEAELRKIEDSSEYFMSESRSNQGDSQKLCEELKRMYDNLSGRIHNLEKEFGRVKAKQDSSETMQQ